MRAVTLTLLSLFTQKKIYDIIARNKREGGTADVNPRLRGIIGQFIWCDTHDWAVCVVPFFLLKMLDARQVVPDVVQARGAREQRARVVAQRVEEDVVDAFG